MVGFEGGGGVHALGEVGLVGLQLVHRKKGIGD